MHYLTKLVLMTSAAFITASVYADVNIPIYTIPAKNQSSKLIGAVTAADTSYGLLLTPNLAGLTPGLHGFHLHQKPFCGNNGMDAGGHLDPDNTNKHLGPYNTNGHLGDIPPLFVDSNGRATLPVLAPRLKESDLHNRALMIHAGGDNYSDIPPMGGGGARIACGVIK